MAGKIGLKTNSINIIGVDHHYDALECICEVMKNWMDDAPILTTYPCTWKGLCNLLDDAELDKVSEELAEACSFMQLWT